MFSRPALRVANSPSLVTKRGFHVTRTRLASPFHYPEGPRTNIPFNPLTKYFAFRYWTFMGKAPLEVSRKWGTNEVSGVGFSLPFAVAVWQTKKNK
ncbi:hypothetical protein MMC34_004234 [Xylographa carneopallida]|nr:hypothetical protein [Xylographa carneopallida]